MHIANAEQAAHNERMAQIRAGTYDFSGVMCEAPKAICAFLVEE